MQSNFETCRSFVKHEEGPYVDDPRDSGNWSSGTVGVGTIIGSNEGVGAPAAISYMRQIITRAWMKALPDAVHSSIFRLYWNRVAGGDLPTGLDLMLIDHGWNRGTGTAFAVLQRVLAVDDDGKPGPATLAAIDLFHAYKVRTDLLDITALQNALGIISDGIYGPHTIEAFSQAPRDEALLASLYAAQVKDYRGLRQFPIYGRGWLARTDRRHGTALAMVDTAANMKAAA